MNTNEFDGNKQEVVHSDIDNFSTVMGNIINLDNPASPLSPILSTNIHQRKIIHSKRNKSRVSLVNKFNEEPKKSNNDTKTKTNTNQTIKKENLQEFISLEKLKKAKELEKHRKKYYELLRSNGINQVHNSNHSSETSKSSEAKKENYEVTQTENSNKIDNDSNVTATKSKSVKHEKESNKNKETLININIKGYKATLEKNVDSVINHIPLHASNDKNNSSKKNVQVILPPNDIKKRNVHQHNIRNHSPKTKMTHSRNSQNTRSKVINEAPERLLQENLTTETFILKSETNTKSSNVSGKHTTKNKNPTQFKDPIIPIPQNSDDFMLSTQETDLYFSNFTPNLAPNIIKCTNENAIDNFYTSETVNSTQDNINPIKPSKDVFLGCSNKEIMETAKRYQALSNLLSKLEDDITEKQVFNYVKHVETKNKEDLPSPDINLIKFEENRSNKIERKPLRLCRSKSTDAISECSTRISKTNHNNEMILHKQQKISTYLSPTKNIQIQIKNNNVINIDINSSFETCMSNKDATSNIIKKKDGISCSKQFQIQIPDDNFASDQQKLKKIVKHAFDNIKFEPNLHITENEEQQKKHNRKKHLDEVDSSLAPANKRNKCEYSQTDYGNQNCVRPEKYKPTINVYNVTTKKPVSSTNNFLHEKEIQNNFYKSESCKNATVNCMLNTIQESDDNFTELSGFKTSAGNEVKVSSAVLHEIEKKFNDDDIFNKNAFTRPRIKKLRKNSRTSPTKSFAPITSNSSEPNLTSFQTASGKNFNIPKSAMEKALHLYNAEENESTYPNMKRNLNDIVSYNYNNENINKTKFVNNDLQADFLNRPLTESKSNRDMYDILSHHTQIKSNLTSFYNELYNKDIQSILNPESSNASNSRPTSFVEDMSLKSDKSSTPKKEYEIIEEVIKTVNNALEKIERKELSNEQIRKRKTLGMRKCKIMPIAKADLQKANQLLDCDNSKNVYVAATSTPKACRTNFAPAQTSTPINRNHTALFAGDCITPVKQAEVKNERVLNNYDDSQIIINLSSDDKYSTKDDYVDEINQLKKKIEILEERKEVLEIQNNLIEHGDEAHRSHRNGYLTGLKCSRKRFDLKELETIFNKENCKSTVINILPQTALHIQFNLNKIYSNNDAVIRTIDGAIIIPNVKNMIGFKEIHQAFMAMPGIQPNLIPKGWLSNHFKWIVWKLASYERKFQLKESVLTVENIIQQLKFRYDKEIYEAKRPTLRKIFESDDIPEKRMVLCVADIFKISENKYDLELTDGWYSVRTLIDKPLSNQVLKNNLIIGTKIIIQNSKLLNCFPCGPLEAPEEARLKINFNNTRKAEWHEKLGYQKNSYFYPISLRSVHVYGGIVSCLKLYIARVYPLKFMEKTRNRKVWRNENAERKAAQKFQMDLEKEVDHFSYRLEELKSDWETSVKKCTIQIDKRDIVNVNCPETLNALIEQSKDPKTLMSMLTSEQLESLLNYKQKLHESFENKVIDEMMKFKSNKKRDVVAVLKLCVYDVDSKCSKGRSLYIWKANDTHFINLKEDQAVMAFNLMPQQSCDFNSTPKTYFKNITSKPIPKVKRIILNIALLMDDNYIPLFNEFDTIGILIAKYFESTHQEIWLADFAGRLICIKICHTQDEYIIGNINQGNVVVACNLIYCKPNRSFAQTTGNLHTTFSSNCKTTYHQEINAFRQLLPQNIKLLLESSSAEVEQFRKRVDVKRIIHKDISMLNSSENVQNETFIDNTAFSSEITEDDIAMYLLPVG